MKKNNKPNQATKKRNNRQRVKGGGKGKKEVRDLNIHELMAAEDEERKREALETSREILRYLSTCADAEPVYALPPSHEAIGRLIDVEEFYNEFEVNTPASPTIGRDGFLILNPYAVQSGTSYNNSNYVTPIVYSLLGLASNTTGTNITSPTSTVPVAATDISASTTIGSASLYSYEGSPFAAPASSATGEWTEGMVHWMPLKACIEIESSTNSLNASGFITTRKMNAPVDRDLVDYSSSRFYYGINKDTSVNGAYQHIGHREVRKVRDAVEKSIQLKWFNGPGSSVSVTSQSAFTKPYMPGALLGVWFSGLNSVNLRFKVRVWGGWFGSSIREGIELPVNGLASSLVQAAVSRDYFVMNVPKNPISAGNSWYTNFKRILTRIAPEILDNVPGFVNQVARYAGYI